jgi:hypothetical protein
MCEDTLGFICTEFQYARSMDSVPIHNLPLYSISSRLVTTVNSAISPSLFHRLNIFTCRALSWVSHDSHRVITLVPRIEEEKDKWDRPTEVQGPLQAFIPACSIVVVNSIFSSITL